MDAKSFENTVTTAAAAHPLEDVELNGNNSTVENIRIPSPSSLSATSSTQSATKKNWVKFDDEVKNTEDYDDSLGGDVANNTNKNRLSPLPPPPVSERTTARAATPSRIESQQQQILQSQPAVAAPDVQRVTSASVSMPDVAPAVLDTESTHVNLNASGNQVHALPHPLHPQQEQQQMQQQLKQYQKSKAIANSQQQSTHNGTTTSVRTPNAARAVAVEPVAAMRTIELSTGHVREGFANGDVIVTLLPANTKWPWITPAIFRPELVPEELMAQGLTLTVEEYVMAMETLVNDYRFTTYNICYKRILVTWILFAFAVLLTLLFSGLQGMALFALGVGWLFVNATAIFVCMWIKLRLARNLEKCLARVNRQLIKHKILLILDDRGRVSCHKVNLCFLYFDATPCVNFLNQFLEQVEQNGGEAIKAGWEAKLDIDLNDIVIQGTQSTRVSRKQAVAQELFLSYLQRWGKDFLRRRLDWTIQEAGVHDIPRHLQSSLCPCQYEEEVLRGKIKLRLKPTNCCGINCIGCWL